MEQPPSFVRRQTGMLWGVAPVNRLALVPADRVIKGNRRGSQSPRRFLDFEVDGQSLYAEFYQRDFDYVGVIWLDPSRSRAAKCNVRSQVSSVSSQAMPRETECPSTAVPSAATSDVGR